MDIDLLDYQKRPFGTSKVFDVHTLTDNGFQQYISTDSFAHKFLDRKEPRKSENNDNTEKLFYSTANTKFFPLKKSILQKTPEESYTSDKNNTLKKKNWEINKVEEVSSDNIQLPEKKQPYPNDDKMKNENNYENFPEEKPEDNSNSKFPLNLKSNTFSNFYNPNKQITKNNNLINFKSMKENNIKSIYKTDEFLKSKNSNINSSNHNKFSNTSNINFNTIFNNFNNSSGSPMNKLQSNYYNSTSNYFTTKSKNKPISYKNLSISTEKSYYYQKSNLDPLSRRLNITGCNFHRTQNADKNMKSNSRFDDNNYLKNLNLFINSKSYLNMDKIVEKESNNKKRYDGFQSYNIPHINNFKSNNDKKISLDYTNENIVEEDNLNEENKIETNDEIILKEKKPISLWAEKIAKSCVGNKKISFEIAQSDMKLKEVQEENEKLKKIMMSQTSSDFLKQSKLPEIQLCVSQTKLKIKKSNLIGGKIKHMGEKYNPYNFQAGKDAETIRRNVNGTLFQH